jgi:hypothetical protein
MDDIRCSSYHARIDWQGGACGVAAGQQGFKGCLRGLVCRRDREIEDSQGVTIKACVRTTGRKTCMRLSLSSARCGLLGQDRGKA